MQAWLESVAGPDYATALMWTIFALIGLLVLLVVIRIVRGLTFGTFVSGGKNRKARLAVMDATAVDSQRRLVLVRRDDIEHLILIGGPTDVVVEQNIRLLPPARRPAQEEPGDVIQIAAAQPVAAPSAPPPPQPAPRPVAARQAPPAHAPAASAAAPVAPSPAPVRPAPPPSYQLAAEPRYAPQATTVTPPRPVPPPQQPAAPAPAPKVEVATAGSVRTLRPVMPVAPAPTPPAAPQVPQQQPVVQQVSVDPVTRAPAPSPAAHDLDDALVAELNEKLDTTESRAVAEATERSLDEEMSKLLGELSNQKA